MVASYGVEARYEKVADDEVLEDDEESRSVIPSIKTTLYGTISQQKFSETSLNELKETTPSPPEENDTNSLYIVITCVLLSDMGRGILFPTLWLLISSLGGSRIFQGYAVSVFSVGRIFSSPIFGRLSEVYGFRSVLISCNIVMALGCLFYTLSIYFQSLHAILISQFVIGFGAGSLGVTRSYVSMTTTKSNRTEYMAYLSAFQYCGFAVSPVLGAIISYTYSKQDLSALQSGVYLNEFSSPALFLVIFSAGCIALLNYTFVDIVRANVASTAVPSTVPLGGSTDERNIISNKDKEPEEGGDLPTEDIDESGLESKFLGVTMIDRVTLGCCLLNVAVRGAVGIFETLVLSFAISHYGWSSLSSGLIVSGSGLFGVIILLNFSYVLGVASDMQLVTHGMVVMVMACLLVSRLVVEEVPQWAFISSIILMYAIGYPIGQTSLLSVFSKVLRSGPQGKMFGLFGSAGSLARVVFPLLAGYSTVWQGDHMVFLLMSALLITALIGYNLSKPGIQHVIDSV